MGRARILLLTWEAFVGDELSEQLNKVFHDRIELLNWYPGCEAEQYEDISLIVCTIKALRKSALEAGVIREEIPYIIAHRSITSAGLAQLERVTKLAPGTRVAVCSNNLDGSRSIVEYLKTLNITHLDFIPYSRKNASEIDMSGVKTAIIFGFPNTHPPEAEYIIDLGKRVLSNQTIIEMIRIGGLNEDLSQLEDASSAANSQVDISVASQLAQVLDNQEYVRDQLAAVLKYTPIGIMITDPDYRIIQCNEIMLEALNKSPAEVLPGTDLLLSSPELWSIAKTVTIGDKSSYIWSLNQNDYLISIYQVGTRQLKEYKIIVLQKAPVRSRKNVTQTSNAKNFSAKYRFEDIRTQDPNMEGLKQFAMRIARNDGNVALYGESGTGKELFAQAIHNYSPRSNGPFVPVNVSALQDSLIESELFGYVEGAFTGARRGGKLGLFELAHTGTIFLDEIGDLSFPLQAKLLRAIQEKEIVRVGGSQIIPIDVRIIAATNKNLLTLVHEGKFRQDLYYRLNVLPLHLLPLRERKADIPLLLQEKLSELGLPLSILSERNIQWLLTYSWPGNVREVENICSYISCLSNLSSEEFDKYLYNHIRSNSASGVDPSFDDAPQHSETNLDAGKALSLAILADMVSAQQKNIPITTKAIYARINAAQKISMGRLRQALKNLEADHMIAIGHTRQGMHVTERGLAFTNGADISGLFKANLD